jgi:biotin carboxylase
VRFRPMKNIFVIGLEPFNLSLLEGLPEASDYCFHNLLAYDEAVRPSSRTIDLTALLEMAEARLAEFSGSIDAIIGYWDFPTSVLVPILLQRHGLPGAKLTAVAACEHKYWSRVEQKNIIPDLVPRYCAVDPFADDPLAQIDIDFPFWIKPIKAHSSYLGFKVRNPSDFEACLPIIRAGIGHFGKPFNKFLSMVEVPQFVSAIDGCHCIAEEIISSGEQCTLEGFASDGEVEIYGVVDSLRAGEHRSCFARYQYPSRLPQEVKDRMSHAAGKFIKHIGYTNAPFNIEFYWDEATDNLRILEVNARISKSHSPLFLMVDGVSHHKIAVDLALGRKPNFPHRRGEFRVAAKFMERVFTDGYVENVPAPSNIARFRNAFPRGLVRVLTHSGQQLAHLPYQDSYSFEIAEMFLGANDEDELLEKHRTAQSLLPFKITSKSPEAI